MHERREKQLRPWLPDEGLPAKDLLKTQSPKKIVQMTKVCVFTSFLSNQPLDNVATTDDLRTSLNYASNCIKALLSAGGRPATSPASPASTSSISPAASTNDPDRTRIDIMKRLGGVLQRNMRVRYELNFAELIQS